MRYTDPDCSNLKTMPPSLDGVPIKRRRLADTTTVACIDGSAIFLNILAVDAWKDMPAYAERAYAAGWHSSPHRNHIVYRGLAAALDRKDPERGLLSAEQLEAAQEVSSSAAVSAAEFIAEVYAGVRAGREFSRRVLDCYAELDGPALKSNPVGALTKFNPNHAPSGSSDGGQFTSDGAGGGVSGGTASDPAADHTATDKERKASLKQARKKIADAPVPTKEQVAKARADLANAARAGGDSRGGSAASRRAQRENLFKEFGGEERGYVVCPWTGLKMSWTDDPKINPNGYPKFERGKIFTKVQGGGYQLPNLIPESFAANRSRNDKPIRPENLR